MNLLALGLILICCNVWSMKTNDHLMENRGEQFADKYTAMEDFLIKLKALLRNGNDTLGIPVLDPYAADRLEIKLNEEIIKLNALLTNIKVNGLSGYDIIHADFKIQLAEMTVTIFLHLSWPLVIANTNYSIKGNIDVFEIYGNGEINVAPQDFAFDTEIKFKIDGGLTGHLKVQEIKLKLSLTTLDFHATGLYDDESVSKILSAVISDMAPEVVNDEKTANQLNPVIRELLDSLLSKITVLDLLKLLN